MCPTASVDPQRDMNEFENEARSWIQQHASEKPKVPIYKQPKPIQQIYETWSSETWSRRGTVLISKQPVVIQESYQTSWRLGCLLMCAAGCLLSCAAWVPPVADSTTHSADNLRYEYPPQRHSHLFLKDGLAIMWQTGCASLACIIGGAARLANTKYPAF